MVSLADEQLHFESAAKLLEKAYAQLGPDFLAVNHLAPYPGWEAFVPLIRQAFLAYRDKAHPSGLRGMGLRYINRIVFPSPSMAIELPRYQIARRCDEIGAILHQMMVLGIHGMRQRPVAVSRLGWAMVVLDCNPFARHRKKPMPHTPEH